jgi:hypothetical protein
VVCAAKIGAPEVAMVAVSVRSDGGALEIDD